MSERFPAHRGWLLVGAIVLIYAFLYDNANSFPAAMGYAWTRLTPIPRQVRLGEILIIGALLALALSHGISRITQSLLIGTFLFIGLGLASYLRGSDVSLLDGVRLIYMWVLPVFIFMIGREAPWGPGAWKRFETIILIWIVASAAVSWFQLVRLGYPVGDDITGLNKDAHANGTLMMFAALAALAFSLFRERRVALLAVFGFLVTMVLSSVLKVMFLGVLSVALIIKVYLRSSVRRRTVFPLSLKLGIAAVATVAVVAAAFMRIDLISSNRLGPLIDKLQNDPANFGPLQAHRVAFAKISGDLPTLALGRGPFQFANPISVGQVMSGGLGKKANSDVLAIADEKGEEARVSLSSSLLAEFGIPAFLVVVLMFGSIGRAIWRGTFDSRLETRERSAAVLACFAILVLVPLTSLFGSLDVMSVTWPVMLMAGLACREASQA